MKYLIVPCCLFFHPILYAEDILVLAHKISPEDRETSSVKVFDEEDIISLQAHTVMDLLKRVSGVHSIHGAFGGASSLFLRGTDNRHTTIIVDGVEISDPTSIHGTARLEFLSLENVSRVEIFKGGSGIGDGISSTNGVIRITTKKPDKKKSLSMKLGYGRFDNRKGGITFLGEVGNFHYTISGDYQKATGISTYPVYNDENADKDGLEQMSGAARIEYKNSSGKKLFMGGRLLKASFEYDEYGQDNDYNYSRYQSNSFFTGYEDSLGMGINPKLFYSLTEVKRNLYEQTSMGQLSYPYKGQRESLRASNTMFYGNSGSVVLGINHTRNAVKNFGSFEEKNIENQTTLFHARHNMSHGQLYSNQGIRLYESQSFGNKAVYNLGMGFDILATTLKANYSTGLTLPSLFTSHGPFGNEKLRPESYRNGEVGIIQEISDFKIQLAYFQIRYDSYIGFLGNRYENTGAFKSEGVEFEVERTKDVFSAKLHTTFLKTGNLPDGLPPLHRPRFKGGLMLDYRPNSIYRLGLDGEIIGKRHSTDNIVLPSYHTIAVRGRYRLKKGHLFQVKIANLLNHHYEEIAGYATLGRNIEIRYMATL